MSTKKEKEEQFDWWITCIPDKINALEEKIPPEISVRLDYTVDSLDILERFLLNTTSLIKIQKDKELWDNCASYIGVVYEKNVPTSKWYIELEDEKDVFYNMPCLKTKNNLMFVPHSEITAALDRNKGTFLSSLTKKHIEIINKL
jgi:hypothetical protein